MNVDFVMSIMNNTKQSYCTNVIVQYATVSAVNEGQAVLHFAGESVNSAKAYKAMKSYVPAVGDRVLILNDVIIGGWK